VFGIDHGVIGTGGAPRGRVIEIIGPESSGKTTLTFELASEAQRIGDDVAFIDAEHALDPTYARNLGVDVDRLLVAQPDNGEQALQAMIDLVESACVGLVIVDSVAALVPQAELEGEMEDAHVGLQARMMAKALRKVSGIANKTGTTIVFINQIREKIGVTFGSKETTPGGRALRFYASLRLDVRRLAQVKEGDTNAGNRTKVKAIKNKVSVPFREGEFDLMFGTGFDDALSLAEYAIANKVWRKDATTYTFQDERVVGKGKVRDVLAENKDVYKATFVATLRAMGKTEDYIKAVSAW
jgi:recombination protein RecA